MPVDDNLQLMVLNLGPGESLSTFGISHGSSSRGTEGSQWFLNINLQAGQAKTYQFQVVNNATGGATPRAQLYATIALGTFDVPDPNYTCTAPAVADTAIAIGSYTHRTTWQPVVGGLQNSGQSIGAISTFSSRGPRIDGLQKPDVVAPGSMVISALDANVAVSGLSVTDDDGMPGGAAHYRAQHGTSMAAPMAAGAGALIIASFPTLTPADVRTMLTATAVPVSGTLAEEGAGLIDVLAALQLLASIPAIPYPGSGADLVFMTGVNESPAPGYGAGIRTALPNDLLNVGIVSPQGAFDLAPILLAAQAFPTGGTVPGGLYPFLHLDPYQAVILVNGLAGPLAHVVLPQGTAFTFLIPQGLTGWSVMLQAAAVTSSGQGGFTDATELRVQ